MLNFGATFWKGYIVVLYIFIFLAEDKINEKKMIIMKEREAKSEKKIAEEVPKAKRIRGGKKETQRLWNCEVSFVLEERGGGD